MIIDRTHPARRPVAASCRRQTLAAPLCAALSLAAPASSALDRLVSFPNESGTSSTFRRQPTVASEDPFFADLGGNGRSCASCHRPEDGWSVTPRNLQQRFDETAGLDPVFRPHDGANQPLAKVATREDRRAAYSLLLAKGLIRIALPIPPDAEFELVALSDPYAADQTAKPELSLFRRPLPATNLRFLSSVMWDGRESHSGVSLHVALRNQANTAATGHAQSPPLSGPQRADIVRFERSLFTAQHRDQQVGRLDLGELQGGPRRLSRQTFYSGINDPTGDARLGSPFDPTVFTLFDAWNRLITAAPNGGKAAIARGQRIFNSRPIRISDVPGLNDSPDFGTPATLVGTCSTCHNVPNIGTHSSSRFMAIGVTDENRRTADLPLYTLRNKATGELKKTTDPGRAMITGVWREVGCFKVPGLRGLAARAPYFHNGMAKTLGNVVDFYDSRFGIGLDNRERLDLIRFLSAL